MIRVYDVQRTVCMYTKYGNLDLLFKELEIMNEKFKKRIEIPTKLYDILISLIKYHYAVLNSLMRPLALKNSNFHYIN